MNPIPAQFWLENARLWIQGGWFLGFGLALGLSIWALKWPHRPALGGWARGWWIAAMLGFVWLWLAGPVVEMMRRAAGVSGMGLLLALGAFSVLLAGVLSLVREWFGATGREPLHGEGVALSLLVLTLAGWWFGGVSLQENPLWNFWPANSHRAPLPDGWALSLGGATLLGLSHVVRSPDERFKRVLNPRAATWWMLALALALCWPWRGQNLPAASAFLAAAGAFVVKMWRARLDCPRFLRVNVGTRAVLVLLVASLPLGIERAPWAVWTARLLPTWKTPLYLAVFWALLTLIFALKTRAWPKFRGLIAPRFPLRLLVHATLVGTVAATLLFGPAGAPFFAFWPLCGLFFDLLAPREHQPEHQRDHQFADRTESEPEFEVAAANARAT